MFKKIAALILALALTLSVLTATAAYDGEYLYQYLEAVAEFLIENGYYVESDADPLANALTDLLENNPEVFEQLLTYMTDDFDERTRHIPSDSIETVLQTSNYIGIGVTITLLDPETNEMEVSAVHESGGAKRAGVQIGDKIVAVNGIPVSEMEFTEVSETMRDGEDGSYVSVSVMRGEQLLRLIIERSYLGEPDYSARELQDGVWLMRWTRFRDADLMDDFYATLEEMKQAGAGGLIIDLRGNGGGLIDMAFNIIHALIPDEGVHFIDVSWREGEEYITEPQLSSGGAIELDQIVILCDGGTASASEIIMSALCETGYAVSVGQRTYGKATAQYEIDTIADSTLIITTYKMNGITSGDYDFGGLYPTYNLPNGERTVSPAAVRLRETPLSFGNCSDDAERLNLALFELGMIRMPEKIYRFGEGTQAAVDNLRQKYALDPAPGADIDVLRLINSELEELSERTVYDDLQLAKALELCNEAIWAE